MEHFQRFRLPGVGGFKKDPAVERGVLRQIFAGAVPAQQVGDTALQRHRFIAVAPVICIGVEVAVFPSRAVDAPYQLSVDDQTAAHSGADDKDSAVGAAFQGPQLQLRDGGSLAVVFQEDTAATALGQPGPYRSADIVEKGGCPAAPHDAMLGINEAGQAHGNAVHLRRVGAIERLQRGKKVLLRVARGGDAARIRPVQLLVHHRVFDLSAAYVKDHNFHTRCLLSVLLSL